ncbi:N-acetylmuramic acid 6-phosphate etherase [Tabrizicola aquatica]|uniref:N-acetylmuramic acid 6-phosphate etherase n=1 Tax=Tabrizicola aquatica TaxID=909926 RepID=UPI000CD2BBF4|nr:N-acetylmuramic acid 6-phosphate etherase [Tabrizicola aquatica]
MADRPTEALHPLAEGLHLAPAAQVLARALSAQQAALAAVGPALPAVERAADLAATALRGQGKLAYAGAGSSGLMALADCLELLGTFGIPAERTPMLFAGGAEALLRMTGGVEDDPALAAADLTRAALGPGDVVIAVSASGTTPYTLAVVGGARKAGAKVIGIANVPDSPLLQAADVPVLLDTGAEIVAGSTRLGAATAQKVAMNLISVLAGVQLGHIHDGMMVNLIADNAKLRDRAARIVARVAGVDTGIARIALNRTQGAVKPAVLVAQGAAPDAAQARLAAAEGSLARAMKS